jgi:hypothetical protein
MADPFQIALAVLAIGYILARRLAGQPAAVRRMIVLPIVLSVIGLSSLHEPLSRPTGITALVAVCVLSGVLGLARGLTVRISEQNRVAVLRYTPLTVALWILTVLVKFGADLILTGTSTSAASAASQGLLLSLGIGMLLEGAVVLARAMRVGATVSWSRRSARGAFGSPPYGGSPHRTGSRIAARRHMRRANRRRW